MKIFLGADHRGFKLKEALKKYLKLSGYEVVDMGAEIYDANDDDVDFARKVCEAMGDEDRGVLFCGSGHGVDITANRYRHIYSILGFNLDVVVQGREHEDANILSIPAEWVSEDEAKEMVKIFLETSFSGKERYKRRIKKIEEIS